MTNYIAEEMKRFNYLTTEIDAAYHEAALKLGLSDSALLILYTICNCGEACLLHDITRLSGISKQTVNSALRKLEDEGVVYLESFSGRKKKVSDGKRQSLRKRHRSSGDRDRKRDIRVMDGSGENAVHRTHPKIPLVLQRKNQGAVT